MNIFKSNSAILALSKKKLDQNELYNQYKYLNYIQSISIDTNLDRSKNLFLGNDRESKNFFNNPDTYLSLTYLQDANFSNEKLLNFIFSPDFSILSDIFLNPYIENAFLIFAENCLDVYEEVFINDFNENMIGFSFDNLFLESYSIKYSLNSLPVVTSTFVVNDFKISNVNENENNFYLKKNKGDILLLKDEVETSRKEFSDLDDNKLDIFLKGFSFQNYEFKNIEAPTANVDDFLSGSIEDFNISFNLNRNKFFYFEKENYAFDRQFSFPVNGELSFSGKTLNFTKSSINQLVSKDKLFSLIFVIGNSDDYKYYSEITISNISLDNFSYSIDQNGFLLYQIKCSFQITKKDGFNVDSSNNATLNNYVVLLSSDGYNLYTVEKNRKIYAEIETFNDSAYQVDFAIWLANGGDNLASGNYTRYGKNRWFFRGTEVFTLQSFVHSANLYDETLFNQSKSLNQNGIYISKKYIIDQYGSFYSRWVDRYYVNSTETMHNYASFKSLWDAYVISPSAGFGWYEYFRSDKYFNENASRDYTNIVAYDRQIRQRDVLSYSRPFAGIYEKNSNNSLGLIGKEIFYEDGYLNIDLNFINERYIYSASYSSTKYDLITYGLSNALVSHDAFRSSTIGKDYLLSLWRNFKFQSIYNSNYNYSLLNNGEILNYGYPELYNFEYQVFYNATNLNYYIKYNLTSDPNSVTITQGLNETTSVDSILNAYIETIKTSGKITKFISTKQTISFTSAILQYDLSDFTYYIDDNILSSAENAAKYIGFGVLYATIVAFDAAVKAYEVDSSNFLNLLSQKSTGVFRYLSSKYYFIKSVRYLDYNSYDLKYYELANEEFLNAKVQKYNGLYSFFNITSYLYYGIEAINQTKFTEWTYSGKPVLTNESDLNYDPFFKNVTLLFQGIGNSKLPISDLTKNYLSENFIISNFSTNSDIDIYTRTSTPYAKEWSVYFDGSNNDYVEVEHNAEFNLVSTSDFTVEFYFYLEALSAEVVFVSKWNSTNSINNSFIIGINASKNIYATFYQGANEQKTTSTIAGETINTNLWYHLAVVKKGSNVLLFLNGNLKITTPLTSPILEANSTKISIGRKNNGGSNLTGNLSNLRIVWQAIYDVDFNVSTRPLSLISNGNSLFFNQNPTQDLVALLIFNKPYFLDDSTHSTKLITSYNSPTVKQFSPFKLQKENNFSSYGGGSFSSINNTFFKIKDKGSPSLDFDIKNNFTIEFWINPQNQTGDILIYENETGSTTYWKIGITNNFVILTYSGQTKTSSIKISLNFWNYIAIVKKDTDLLFYVNGKLSDIFSNFVYSDVVPLNQFLKVCNNLNNFHFSNSALYNGDDISIDQKVIQANEFSKIHLFFDVGYPDKTLNNLIQVNLKNSEKYYNWFNEDGFSTTKSLTRDSSPVYGMKIPITKNNISEFTFNSDFTIEFWLRVGSVPENLIFLYFDGSFAILIDQTFRICVGYWNNTTQTLSNNIIAPLPINSTNMSESFSHIAVVRSSGVIKVYINGTQTGNNYSNNLKISPTLNENIFILTPPFKTTPFNKFIIANIANIRVTKDTARYTQLFNSPTSKPKLL